MGSEYTKKLAEAVDILINKRLAGLGYDQTVIAIVSEIVDAEAGKYKIEYESAIFEAEASDTSKRYRVKR
jgi:hypothetical protein